VQTGQLKQPYLSAAAVSPDGKNVAFFELDYREFLADEINCPFSLNNPVDTAGTSIFLMGATIRLRDAADKSENDNASVSVSFPGGFFNTNNLPAGQTTAYPHHRFFELEGMPFYRGSFSPDGTKFVFSDGLNLRIWTIGQSTTVVIPNTDDAILPAWSPDGTQIAYSRHPRTRTQKVFCEVMQNGVSRPVSTISKTIYTDISRELIELLVIKPDGTGQRSLGLGDAPAWASDSKTIVAHRDNNLVRINIDTQAATVIANTKDAFEPALSRDNKFLAFARRATLNNTETQANYNIWVAAY
jgi:Tol biopolymer transport system component